MSIQPPPVRSDNARRGRQRSRWRHVIGRSSHPSPPAWSRSASFPDAVADGRPGLSSCTKTTSFDRLEVGALAVPPIPFARI